MVSPAMGAAIISTMYFLRANCGQHGGGASGGGMVAPLHCLELYFTLTFNICFLRYITTFIGISESFDSINHFRKFGCLLYIAKKKILDDALKMNIFLGRSFGVKLRFRNAVGIFP